MHLAKAHAVQTLDENAHALESPQLGTEVMGHRTSKQRSTLMPDLPTIAESGVPDYDLSGWISLFAPAGTPRPIIDRLNAEVTKVLALPEIRTRLHDLGAEPSPMPVAEFGAWVQQEVNKWTRLVKEAGIQPE